MSAIEENAVVLTDIYGRFREIPKVNPDSVVREKTEEEGIPQHV
jgi:hypothetical protein